MEVFKRHLLCGCGGTWLSGGLGSVRLMVGLDDLKRLFQSKSFHDSVTFAVNLCTLHLQVQTC